MTYASAADVTTPWAKEPEPEVISLIERRLEQVERMIKRRIPDLAVRITAGDIDGADVVDIEADAVLRVVRNPLRVLERDRRRIHLPASIGSLQRQADNHRREGGDPRRQTRRPDDGSRPQPRCARARFIVRRWWLVVSTPRLLDHLTG